ncbi:uncharacterized protein K460DRAFT_263578, partial [Cucurbitaria berberidis CBS 394.84]
PHMSGLKIKIPKGIWNSHDPNSHKVTKSGPRLRLKVTPSTRDNISRAATQPQPISSKERTHCKVKLWRFHYGGPKRKGKGKSENEITYEQPCLKPTCANCWRWHSQLVQTNRVTKSEGDEQQDDRPNQEPSSLEIDPRILNGTWQHFQGRRGSVES